MNPSKNITTNTNSSTNSSTSSENKWFLQLNGQIQGPFDQGHLLSTLQGLNEESNAQALVWKRGLTEWVKTNKWQNLDQVTANNAAETTHIHEEPENSLFEKTFNQTFQSDAFYRVQLSFIDQPLMSKIDLMTFIAKQPDVSKISIQDPKTKLWKEVYAFPDIVERLGLSRRKQSRVPILAQFTGKLIGKLNSQLNSQLNTQLNTQLNSSTDLNCRVITISQGGIGFTENFELKIGDEVEGQVSSPHFFQPVNIKADVIYAGDDGYIGLKFSQVTDEALSSIIDYIKKFGADAAKPF